MAGLADALMAGPAPPMGPKKPALAGPAEVEAVPDELDIPAQDLVDAMKTGDVEKTKAALRAAFAVMDVAEPEE